MVKKRTIPNEFRCEFAITGYTTMLKGFMYVIRERHGATEALACFKRFFEMDDRIRNMTEFLQTVFKIEGNDAETVTDWLAVWYEIFGFEYEILELSKTISRIKVTKCPWKTGYKDVSDWPLIWTDLVSKTINPKLIFERPKGMCAGDPYCEYVHKIEK